MCSGTAEAKQIEAALSVLPIIGAKVYRYVAGLIEQGAPPSRRISSATPSANHSANYDQARRWCTT